MVGASTFETLSCGAYVGDPGSSLASDFSHLFFLSHIISCITLLFFTKEESPKKVTFAQSAALFQNKFKSSYYIVSV